LGLLFSLFMMAFMMAQIPLSSRIGFAVWLGLGLLFYFATGVRHSRLARRSVE